jgi:signal transduction histidine kinase
MESNNSEPTAEVFDRKYRIAMGVVMLLVLCNQALVQPYLMRLTTDAPLINTAGRQRMLSQRLAKAALAFERGKGKGTRAYLEEMRSVLSLWSAAHQQLIEGNSNPLSRTGNTASVSAGLSDIEPSFVSIRNAAEHFIQARETESSDTSAADAALAVILNNEAEYLQRMDGVVGLYEREAWGRVDKLRMLSWAVTSLTLGILVARGMLVLDPAPQLIRRQVSELRQARDELEVRVQERSRELETATERHRTLLEQFSHVGRTTAIGEMASALAHELNQPLGAIANYAEGCLIELDAPRPNLGGIRDALERLRAATMRSGQIIQQIRKFVTRQATTPESFDANLVVREVIEILRAEARQRNVTITLELAQGLPSLRGEPVQIQQVLLNLVRNAFDAMESQTQEPTLVIRTRRDGNCGVEFTICDNGEGIPSEWLNRIFDAYFSTRVGGMGMGLAICRTIVEAHQGRFVVESDPGVSTTFRFILPVAETEHVQGDGLHRR